jgi:1-acyl-sn-glycerol-3-phosphate acyltransferase
MTPSQASFYRLLRLTLSPAVRDAFQMQIEGLTNVPRRGPALIVCNHRSFVDPFLLGAAVPRTMNFLAASFVFKIPGFGRLAAQTGAIPVDISGGRRAAQALDRVVDCLRQGQVVGIFPEGVASFRKGAEGIARFQMGFVKALAAARMPELPVIPCAIVAEGERALAELPPALMRLIDRSDQFAGSATELRVPRQVWVGIGKPLLLGQLLGDEPERPQLQAATEAVRAQVHQLHERGASHLDIEPAPMVFDLGPLQLRVARKGPGGDRLPPDLGLEEAMLANYPGTWAPSPQPGEDWLLISDRKLTLWRPPSTNLPLAWEQIAEIRTQRPAGAGAQLLIQERNGSEHHFTPADPTALPKLRSAIADALAAAPSDSDSEADAELWQRDLPFGSGL